MKHSFLLPSSGAESIGSAVSSTCSSRQRSFNNREAKRFASNSPLSASIFFRSSTCRWISQISCRVNLVWDAFRRLSPSNPAWLSRAASNRSDDRRTCVRLVSLAGSSAPFSWFDCCDSEAAVLLTLSIKFRNSDAKSSLWLFSRRHVPFLT